MNPTLWQLYHLVFPNQSIRLLRKELADCASVLDLGCGPDSRLSHCGVRYSLGVDIFAPYLLESRAKGIHSDYIRADLTQIGFRAKKFDAVLLLDVLEHLSKDEADKLLARCEEWVIRKIIVEVPNGYVWQGEFDDNPWQIHKSEWHTSDLRRRGFRVYGTLGWKPLRGYRAVPRFRPRALWSIVCKVTQRVTYFLPDHDYKLFGVKTLCSSE